MKKLNILLLAALVGFSAACTDEFEDINKNPNKVEELAPGYQFGGLQLNYAGNGHEEWRGNLIMTGPLAGITQCAYRSGESFGVADGFTEAKWSALYKNSVKNGMDMLRNLNAANKDGNMDAKIAETEIFLQLVFQRLTDLYGDIPYSEAGQGYNDLVYYPVYDSQKDVYKGMVSKLKTYRDQLLTVKGETFDASEDIIYGHMDNDSRKKAWAKLANSMLLRIGMRASTADAVWAKEVVEEAANNAAGFIDSYDNTVSALVKHSTVGGPWGIHENGSGSAINGKAGGFAYCFLGEEYLHMAQQRKDPRLFYVGCQVIFKEGDYSAWTGQTYFDPFDECARPGEPWKPVVFTAEKGGSTESFSVRGMMTVDGERVFCNYHLDQSLFEDKTYTPDSIQFYTLCGVNPKTIGNREAPTIVYGADETYYILAEAAAKGWNVPGDAKANLEKALRFTFAKYPGLYPSDGSPETYMQKYEATTGNKADYSAMTDDYISTVGAATVETIQLERWKSLLINNYEAFALWNRTALSVTSVKRPYNDSENFDVPAYTKEDMKDIKPGVVVPTDKYTSEPFHNGGDTGGYRPRRLDYPNAERSNNATNVKNAIAIQEKTYGNSGSNFISAKMWISK
ncbi:SusD/RagB family nutrient-binding outer membrane lipoprotein [Marinilabiliaceae bacterium JC017]|nr:SusD/RagB family nutrient-binding outer membrane lipoprotein [Marinilabiliaceae bacterium JC017]